MMESTTDSRWVFGYGSLIWRPGFAFKHSVPARVEGLHRALCVYSYHYRGTPARPGLVFGLKPGGHCHGMAFEVAAQDWPDVHAYLRAREQITMVYQEAFVPIGLADGRTVEALTYTADMTHEQYADLGSVDDLFALVALARGEMGPNRDYVLNTLDHLTEMGIVDDDLAALGARLRASTV